ncbi:MAG: 1-deoxy-D-xylulose-5-phosphate reductoisomerase [Pseudomonadota bacterium]|jgi:1-deoxy-D-xylulose-5-phosphate reductoisomerase|uniref:1-deoxy-D-xylulose-5-phosphate reductoisomerase n=1 Tax=Alloalcanivorax venustensis TaxID=172371 RepID=UPI001A3D50B7|nr:1-deoxy-D-xylulose-5-phosphate reductoisomerase [Alcanivorax sp.]MED5601435.1 1-deoxy-D-xylulose-5-phosphate reductoisomerase [Pseudomonadota bacterium]MEE3009224.1 1-deoxy-D-xylulose-5-phosphate reductoisomerase [Pseudomonadota bacterium]
MTDRSLETVTILGATGSIGRQTLDVLARNPERYRVLGLTAGHRWRELAEHCLTWRPAFAALADEQAAEALRNHLREAGSHTQVLAGHAGVAEVAALQEADTVVAAIVGAAGVRPTLAAVEAGKKILLANKETLVVTGALFMEAVKRHGATLLPVDSEHNAIFQCLPAEGVGPGVRRLLLTASGGPFRGWTREQLTAVTPEQAVCHPNWDMGPKISVDSATLMNKGLEYIEACWLFDVAPQRIEVVIHPQSVVHSMVEYLDGSVLAQMGTPDMRTPIACALSWPERIESGASRLDFATLSGLDFQAPDNDAFPCLGLARQAMEEGGAATAVLNAANEEAVAAFLDRRLGFNAIGAVVEETLQRTPSSRCADVDAVMDVDARARDLARSLIREWAC